jgi:uncharacterized protein YukE
MGKYVKYRNRIEKFLQTERGKRFLNYAYSFGAAIVIFGAMAKLLYLPFGNVLLAIGMITEICVFVISAFDRPVKDYNWEEVFPVLASNNPEDRPNFTSGTGITGEMTPQQNNNYSNNPEQIGKEPSAESTSSSGGNYQSFSPNSFSGHPSHYPQNNHMNPGIENVSQPIFSVSGNTQPAASSPRYTDDVIGNLGSVSDNVQKFAEATETLTRISESLQESYRYIIDHSQEIGQNSLGYVQQMEALNRNISGLNTIYEIQLRSISGQIETIDQINAGLLRVKTLYNDSIPDGSIIKQETEKMAAQLQELNSIYARMIEAMTINMNRQNPA